MSPSPTRKHQRLGSELVTELSISLRKQKTKCDDCDIVYETDWIIDDENVLTPDIAVICNETGDFISKPPIIIVEISSPSTALKDRQLKYEVYQEQGVKYYVIANPNNGTYTIFQLENGQYIQQKDLTQFDIHENCTLELDLKRVMSELK